MEYKIHGLNGDKIETPGTGQSDTTVKSKHGDSKNHLPNIQN